MSAYSEASKIAADGLAFGELLWPVIEASGLPNRAARVLHFEVALDHLADDRPGSHASNAVWHAYAMKAIPMVELDEPARKVINRKAESACETLIDELLADQQFQAADHYHDMRDEVAA